MVNLDGVESSTNELPLSAITFGRGGEAATGRVAAAGRVASWPHLAAPERGGRDGPDGPAGCTWRGAGRRQRHSIAGQMSYLKMLGLGARGKLPGAAAGLFSTAVISGSSSAPNLRIMIPTANANNSEYLINAL